MIYLNPASTRESDQIDPCARAKTDKTHPSIHSLTRVLVKERLGGGGRKIITIMVLEELEELDYHTFRIHGRHQSKASSIMLHAKTRYPLLCTYLPAFRQTAPASHESWQKVLKPCAYAVCACMRQGKSGLDIE